MEVLIIFGVVGALAMLASVVFKPSHNDISLDELDISLIESEVSRVRYHQLDGVDNLEEAVEEVIDFMGLSDEASEYIRAHYGL